MSTFGAVWHYWLAVPIAAAAIGLTLALVVGYWVKVTNPRVPKK